jgi:cobalt-zinc-cadmium efflux system membrane fusion protein
MNGMKQAITGGLCALLAVLMAAGGCGKTDPDGHSSPAPGAPLEKHGPDDGHGRGKAACGPDDGHGRTGEAEGAPGACIEERANAPCEHAIPIYQCDECRYEVGVVKLNAGILKRSDGSGLVRTQVVARTRVASSLAATGEVALNENATAHISPRIAGIIDAVPADVGMRVKAGDPLLTLSSVELGRALAEYERNRALTELSEKVFKREARLKEQNVGSEQDMIGAQMTFEEHRADLRASEQMLHVLGLSEEDMAETREAPHGVGAGRLSVRAPFAGTLIEKHAVPGELAEPGREVMLLSDLTTVWVWANVHSRDLAGLLAAEKRGTVEVEITVAAFPGRQFKGKLDYVGATMDEETRTVKVRSTIENPDQALRPGMFCEVSIAIGNGRAEEVLAVPRAAVFTDEGKSFVFKRWKDDFFARQAVRTGRDSVGMVEILEGIQPGDVVAAEGGFLLKSDVLREKMGAGCAD